MSMARSSRMLHYIGYRMRITMQDSRTVVGTFMAFDRHMNMILGDSEEFRKIKSKKGSGLSEREERRALGLIILRGDAVVSLSIEGPPPPDPSDNKAPGGPGVARAVGRGMPVAPPAQVGLSGPIRGVGGPAPSMMMPQMMMSSGPPPMGQGYPGMPPMGGASKSTLHPTFTPLTLNLLHAVDLPLFTPPPHPCPLPNRNAAHGHASGHDDAGHGPPGDARHAQGYVTALLPCSLPI